MFIDEPPITGPRIKVIGVGGGGGNAVNRMIDAGIKGVDSSSPIPISGPQRLESSDENSARQQINRGLGAGSNPEVGREAALEDTKNCSMCSKAPTWSL